MSENGESKPKSSEIHHNGNNTEQLYQTLSELTPQDILPGCGYDEKSGNFNVFLQKYVVKALRDPDWLFNPADYEKALSEGLEPTAFMPSPERIAYMQTVIQERGVDTVARGIVDATYHRDSFPSQQNNSAIVLRGFELLGKDHPNFMLFRGTSYNPQHGGYLGRDFYVGWLPGALKYARKSYSGTRNYPIVAMLPIKDIAQQMRQQEKYNHFLPCNDEYYAVELPLSEESRSRLATIKKLPAPEVVETITKTYYEKALQI